MSEYGFYLTSICHNKDIIFKYMPYFTKRYLKNFKEKHNTFKIQSLEFGFLAAFLKH